MSIDQSVRKGALEILQQPEGKARSKLLKAIFDLRHNGVSGDESILFPLLNHEDDGVVASTLYSLWEVYGRADELVSLVRDLAWGDDRDTGEMPIQCMAISLLSRLAKDDFEVRIQLQEIAEDSEIALIPCMRAWEALAESYGAPWQHDYADELVLRPDSEASEAIRSQIRQLVSGNESVD
jgi:hypothetical protein